MSDSGESGTGHTIMPLGLGLEGRATVAGSQPADWMGAAGFEPEARPGKAERLSLVRNQPTGWARLVSNRRRGLGRPSDCRWFATSRLDGRGWFRTSDLSRVKRALSH